MKSLILTLCLLSIASSQKLPKFNIDLTSISTSGLSSGAYMVPQLHFAHSKIIKGAGVIAGGPYYCAQASMVTALTACMSAPTSINVAALISHAKQLSSSGAIDDISNLKDSKVYIFASPVDHLVNQGAGKKAEQMYKELGANVQNQYTIKSAHGHPTQNYGNPCATQQTPFIQKCEFSVARELLTHLLGGQLKDPVPAVSSNLKKFDQSQYAPLGSSMHKDSYYYAGSACLKGETCKLHIVFHGCQQTLEDIQTQYVEKTEYNELAEANNLIILYPQAKKSNLAPSNPNGCFDWWGYADPIGKKGDYVTKAGKQISAVYSMIKDLTGINE